MNPDHVEIILYQSEDGKSSLDVHLKDETVWLTQAQIVVLFRKTKQNISLHIRNIFGEGELHEDSVVKEYLTTAADGKRYKTKYYFIFFLQMNGLLDHLQFDNKALVALALLTATSDPGQKDILIRLIVNLLARGE